MQKEENSLLQSSVAGDCEDRASIVLGEGRGEKRVLPTVRS